jgi:predicted N-acetyltransferase YhbS
MKPTPIIRPEVETDTLAIREITRAAFEHMPFAAGDEHELIDTLRGQSRLYLSLVAEWERQVVGHIAFSRATAADQSGRWFALGPVSVTPSLQGKGIGAALVEAGLKTLAVDGATGCILTGDPDYYARFGFVLTPELAPAGEPAEYFQIKLIHGSLPSGKIHFDAAFGSSD